jgi:hypothetical protein
MKELETSHATVGEIDLFGLHFIYPAQIFEFNLLRKAFVNLT